MNIEEFFAELSALFTSGNRDKIGGYLKQSLAQAETQGDAHAAITVLNEMIGHYRSVSDHKQALAASERAIEAVRLLGYEDTPGFGTTLLNVATAYRAAGDSGRALDLYLQGLEVYQRHLEPDDSRLAGLYNNLSALHMESGDYHAAIKLLRQSAHIMADKKENMLDTATIHSNLALALLRSGDKEAAGAALGAAVSIFETFEASGLDAPHYAAALAIIAETRYDMGDPAAAAGLYERALAHIKKYFGENEEFAVTAANCAMAYEAMNDARQAEKYRALARAAGRQGVSALK